MFHDKCFEGLCAEDGAEDIEESESDVVKFAQQRHDVGSGDLVLVFEGHCIDLLLGVPCGLGYVFWEHHLIECGAPEDL